MSKRHGSNRSTPSALLQAVWGILVSRLSGDDDIVFGNVVSGRPAELAGIEDMVGMFHQHRPGAHEGRKPPPARYRKRVDPTFRGRGRNTNTPPLHQIQTQAPIPKGGALFETLFVYENYPVDERLREESNRDFVIRNVRGSEAPHYPLSLAVLPGDQYTLQLTFDRSRL